jgi:lipoprotein-releasing system ATP-binding protein
MSEARKLIVPRRARPSAECGIRTAELSGSQLIDVPPSTSDAQLHSPLQIPHSEFRTPNSTHVHLSCRGLKKTYRKGPLNIPVLTGVDLEVRQGEFLAIVGQSGSGKSTLLHLLGTLDAPTAGEVHFLSHRIDNLPATKRERLRNEQFGMIFQFYHLLPELTTLENTLAPLMIGRSAWKFWCGKAQYIARAQELLEIVGLTHRLKHRPRELSGGEMQRVAIARALIAFPQVLLADEPTGNLDQETGSEILQILRTLNRDRGLSIVMVTHDAAIASQADRIVRLAGGQVEIAT